MTTSEPIDTGPERARRLFRYVTVDDWREYRAIMAVFAGTFFAEFTPDEVAARLHGAGTELDTAVVGDRLESLRGWGNLTVSSSVGNPANLADYYRRRNRYLITRAGQEVHALVEGVLARVDEVRDVSTGRLRALLDALDAIDGIDPAAVDRDRLADLVRAVFDAHDPFADEITQFFASINQWQSRYDLAPEEFRFFAEVLVGYVAERLSEIERLARPIARRLAVLDALIPSIVARMEQGLAARVDEAGLAASISVTRVVGGTHDDWRHLATWFVGHSGAPSRIDRLGRDALAAIRTLTLNLTRLSRVGIAAASRRADFLRLARVLADADPDDVARLAAAAFGLHSANHFGVLAEDAADPVPVTTSWWDAPKAAVPISIRERADTANRGRTTPIADRSTAQELLRRRRDAERRAGARVDAELLDAASIDGAELSPQALARLQQLVGRTSHRAAVGDAQRSVEDGAIRCVVRRVAGAQTVVHTSDGTLTMRDLEVRVEPVPREVDRRPVEVIAGE